MKRKDLLEMDGKIVNYIQFDKMISGWGIKDFTCKGESEIVDGNLYELTLHKGDRILVNVEKHTYEEKLNKIMEYLVRNQYRYEINVEDIGKPFAVDQGCCIHFVANITFFYNEHYENKIITIKFEGDLYTVLHGNIRHDKDILEIPLEDLLKCSLCTEASVFDEDKVCEILYH